MMTVYEMMRMAGISKRTKAIIVAIHWPTRRSVQIQLPFDIEQDIIDPDAVVYVYRTHLGG